MPRRPRSRVRLLVVLAAAVVVGGACGSGSTASPPPPTTRPASPSTAPSAPGSPDGPSATPAGSPATPSGPFDPAAVAVSVEPVVDIPGAPLAIAVPDDGSGRLFVAERGGRVWIVRDGRRIEGTFLDIATRVTAGGEQGLLGLAFHPSYPDDPRFYVYYTNRDRDHVVAERRVDPSDPDRADPDHEREILRMDDFAANHNGGALVFGPDGHLYVATGDGGGAGDPQGTGQRLDTLLGKILRIDVGEIDADAPYRVPADNPFVGRSEARPEIWHLGLRNPWRFSFDHGTGDLWIGDVGQNAWEEIDVARDGVGGLNFGWSVTEGRHCFRDEGCSTEGLTPPVTEYSHDLGCSVTGGVVYRGSAWPELVGAYLFADYCSGRLWAIDGASESVDEPVVVAETGRSIAGFGEDAAREVYLADLSGSLLRLVAPAR
jgi:glucose/arabinose dehydrogenase